MYDIDAVSIALYDIDSSGRLVTWSCFSDLSSVKNLKKSLEFDFPTGLVVLTSELVELYSKELDILKNNPPSEFKEYNRLQKHVNLLKANKEFKEGSLEEAAITISNLIAKYVGEEKAFARYLDEDGNTLLETKNINDIVDFINSTNKSGFYELTDLIAEILTNPKVNPKGWLVFNGMLPLELKNLYNKLIELANKHNRYLENTNAAERNSAALNLAMYQMYMTTLDPINLLQSLFSVDAATGPVKEIGNRSFAASLVTTRTPGNFANSSESILENQVGKMGIAICAVGMKGFFGLSAYANHVINDSNLTDDEKQKIRINNGNGITIAGKTYTDLANVNPQKLAKTSDWITQLGEANTEEDVALVLSAMLSLATDKQQRFFHKF